jgi:hypothetical protein
MKNVWIIGLTLAALAAGMPALAEAGTIVYNIENVISGNGVIPGNFFGTATLEDNGTSVDLSVALDESSPYISAGSKLLAVYLNYDPLIFDNQSKFTVSTDSISNDEDALKADGFHFCFDLSIPVKEKLKDTHDYTTTISWSGHDLDPDDFNFSTGGVYMAFHIGALEKNSYANSDSVWAGATPVPIPGGLLLFASGLLALRLGGKRFKRKGVV